MFITAGCLGSGNFGEWIFQRDTAGCIYLHSSNSTSDLSFLLIQSYSVTQN